MISNTGVEVEVSEKMMRNAYIGYDRMGSAIFSGVLGVGHLKHLNALAYKIVVGVDTWEALKRQAQEEEK